MEKSKFEKFINKYNLAGACESVLYTVEGKTLTTRAISDDKSVVVELSAPAMGLPAGSYPVYETAKLKSLLGVLDENLNVAVKTSDEKAMGLKFSDANSEVTFVLADATVIPPVPDIKKMPPFDLTVTVDSQFITTFVKAKNALSEADTFTVMADGNSNTADIIIGYSSLNTNRVKLTVNTKEAVEFSPINFSAKYLRDILVANKDAPGAELLISSKGLAKSTFEVDGIKATYYLVQQT
jgi:hypothetical protein